MPFKDTKQQKAYMKKWHQEHKKEDEAYYLKNKEYIVARSKAYNDEHKEKIKKYNKEYAKKYMPDYLMRQTDKIRIEIHTLLGNKCVHCGFLDDRALQVDHVKGNGYEERLKFHSFYSRQKYILAKIKSGSKDYQLLCANCNWIKRWENPNERRRGKPSSA